MSAPTFRYNDFDTKDLIIRHITSNGVAMPLRHLHSQYEFIFVRGGKATMESNTTVLEVNKPTLIVHKPFSLHRTNAGEDSQYDRYLIIISNELLERRSEFVPGISFFSTAGTAVIPLEGDFADSVFRDLDQLCQDFRNEKKYQTLLKTALLLLSVTEYAAEMGIPQNTSG